VSVHSAEWYRRVSTRTPSERLHAIPATFLLFFFPAAFATSVGLQTQQPSACGVPLRRAEIRDRFERLVASEDSLDSVIATATNLPPDSVLIVTDEVLCERAARAYYRDKLGPAPSQTSRSSASATRTSSPRETLRRMDFARVLHAVTSSTSASS
jgi:hypothetical protein